MKRLAIFLIFLCAGAASGSDYANGYVADGYTYMNGLWYGQQGGAFTRERYWQPGWYSYPNGYCGGKYGCCCVRVWNPGYYFYKYFPYYAPAQTYVQPKLPTYNDPGWRSKILDIAMAREKLEGEITRSAFEQQNYMEAVQALGLRAARPNIPYVGVYGLANYGVQGNTQYGYAAQSYNTIAQVYGSSDLNVLYQQAAQLTAGAQRLGGEANQGFQALVGTEGANRARVAEIIAKGQMAQQILNSLAAAPSAEVRGYSFKIEQGKIQRIEDPKTVTPDQKAALRDKLAALFEAKCVSCHGAENAKGAGAMFPGGFKCQDWFKYSNEQKNRAWETISSADPAKRMPLGVNGGPGVPLTPDEQRLLFLN